MRDGMLSRRIQDAITGQIASEFEAAYLYLSMSAHFDAASLRGFASWMRNQAQEEVAHAMKLFDFLSDRGIRPILQTIPAPPTDLGSHLEVVQRALAHEKGVSGKIHALYQLAGEEKDFATQAALQWFLLEQVEEEKTAGEIVDRVRMAGDYPGAMLLLDRELGARTSSE